MRAFRLAYDGVPYAGFQRQPDVATVEGALFDGLAGLDLHDPAAAKPPGYTAAGRTDAGVSALAQTIAFECPEWCSPAALNAELPRSIRAWAAAEAPPDFHAGLAARRRTYEYHLLAPGHDDALVSLAADRLAGSHDFHNLTSDDEGTDREVAIDLARDGDFVTVTVTAGGFPRQLVRRLVTLLAEVGAGDRSPDAVDRVLGPAPLPGPDGVAPAPPEPLLLADVAYDLSFEPDVDAAAAAEAVFAETRDGHRRRARAAGSIADGLREGSS